jgi:hypothetical protein
MTMRHWQTVVSGRIGPPILGRPEPASGDREPRARKWRATANAGRFQTIFLESPAHLALNDGWI